MGDVFKGGDAMKNVIVSRAMSENTSQKKLTPLPFFQPQPKNKTAPRPRVLPVRRLCPRQRPLGAQGAAFAVLLGSHDQGRERLVKK